MVDAEVLSLFPSQGDDDRPVATQPYVACRHKRVSLDDEAHRVYCRACGREVDAYAALRRLAYDWEAFISMRREAERRTRVAEAKLAVLLREERNAKARKQRRMRTA